MLRHEPCTPFYELLQRLADEYEALRARHDARAQCSVPASHPSVPLGDAPEDAPAPPPEGFQPWDGGGPRLLGRLGAAQHASSSTAAKHQTPGENPLLFPSSLPQVSGDTQVSSTGTDADSSHEILHLWHTWTEQCGPTNVCRPMSTDGVDHEISRRTTDASDSCATLRSGDIITGASCLQRWVSRPNSSRRVLTGVCSFLVLGYDICTIPLMAFPFERRTINDVLDTISTIFWTIDIPNTCLTGYYVAGLIEMRPIMIMRRYAKTTFAWDFTVVALDYISLGLEGRGGAETVGLTRITKSMRIARVLRVLRIARILKVRAMLEQLDEHIRSEYLSTVMGIVKIIVSIVVVNHFFACAWYALGNLPGHGEQRWVAQLEARTPGEVSVGYAFACAFHWALCQFTPASMEIVPMNTAERTFTILVVFFALVTFSSFVSSVTAAMTFLRKRHRERTKELDLVRRYLEENRISIELGNRVRFMLQTLNGFTSRKRVHNGDVPAFKLLPETLRVALHYEVFLPVLQPHPLFSSLCLADERCVVLLCRRALTEQSLAPCQELFNCGQSASSTFMILAGDLSYKHGLRLVRCRVLRAQRVTVVSEAALWCEWVHRGRITATSAVELVRLEGERVRSIVAGCPTALHHLRIYAALFVQRLCEQTPMNTCSDSDQSATGARDLKWSACASSLSDVSYDPQDAQQMARMAFATAGDTNVKRRVSWGGTASELLRQWASIRTSGRS